MTSRHFLHPKRHGATPSALVFITNATMDSPFEEMHRMGWGAALVVAFAILSLNVAVRALARERKR